MHPWDVWGRCLPSRLSERTQLLDYRQVKDALFKGPPWGAYMRDAVGNFVSPCLGHRTSIVGQTLF